MHDTHTSASPAPVVGARYRIRTGSCVFVARVIEIETEIDGSKALHLRGPDGCVFVFSLADWLASNPAKI